MLRHHKFGRLCIWTLQKTCNQSRRFAMHITKKWFCKQTTIFGNPPVRVIISISPPKKREIDIPRGQNPWFESIAEKNGAQGWSPNLLVLNPNRMLSFATQKMHLFGASCCPGWSSYMVLLNHVRHFGVNCVLFGAFVGLEWNSCIYNR